MGCYYLVGRIQDKFSTMHRSHPGGSIKMRGLAWPRSLALSQLVRRKHALCSHTSSMTPQSLTAQVAAGRQVKPWGELLARITMIVCF